MPFAALALLTTVLMRDDAVAGCAHDSSKTPEAYVAKAFDLRSLTLHGGERMTVAIAKDPCLALGQSTRIMIFEQTSYGYRRVLNDVTLPSLAQVSSDGTAMLPTHDSVEVIFEATYVWNGSEYVFSPSRSHRYDVALGERRPYEIPIAFAPGQSETTLNGTVAHNFGNEYVFQARSGQTLTIELLTHARPLPSVSLYFQSDASILADLSDTGQWSGKLLQTGTYHLVVDATDESAASTRSPYAIRLSIH
jgi:hypothetical protein